MSKGHLPVTDWLLTETVRLHEERHGRFRDDDTANVLARETAGHFADALSRRAAALPCAAAVRADLQRLRCLGRWLVLLMLLVALVAGVLAALSSAATREVDVLLAAASLLVLPGLMLVLWFMLMLFSRPGQTAPSLSGGLLGLGIRRLGPRVLSGPLAAESVAAATGLLLSRPGRWLLGTFTHAFWALYSLAALALLGLLFSIAQYDLSWGTTLLTDETVVVLIQGLAWAPAALGLIEAPSAEWILAGREGVESGALRAEWARFLLVLVASYGLLPRLVLLGLCAILAVVGLRHVPVQTFRPGYLRLAGVLVADGKIDTRGQLPTATKPPVRTRPRRSAGPPLLVGVELEREDWPVELPGLQWRALGRADTRSQRAGLQAAIDSLETPPPAVLVQCSALRTPDEGAARFLSGLADVGGTVLVIWLDEIEALRTRGGDLSARCADWQNLAGRIGAEMVVFDADAPDEAALEELARIAGVSA